MNGKEKVYVGIACAGVVAVTAAWVAQPDGPPEPKKYADVEWFSVVNVDYYASGEEAALKMVFEEFLPAARAAGLTGASFYEYATGGEWDLMIVFPMNDGPAGLEWEVSPEDIRFFGALAERAGGADEAKALFEEYSTHIARHESNVVRRRK